MHRASTQSAARPTRAPAARMRWESSGPEARRGGCGSRQLFTYCAIATASLWLAALSMLGVRGSGLAPEASSDDTAGGALAEASKDAATRSWLPPRNLSSSHAGPAQISYVMCTFQDGSALGDGLHLLVSADGLEWSELPGAPVILPVERLAPARVFRDPSIVWFRGAFAILSPPPARTSDGKASPAHGPTFPPAPLCLLCPRGRLPSRCALAGHFHLVFTSDLCVDQVPGHWQCRRHTVPRPVARFGYARSRDLVDWEGFRLVEVPLKGACSLWAPEVSVLPASEGGGLLVTFSATVTTQPGELCPHTMRESDHSPHYVLSRDLGMTWSKPRRMSVGDGTSIIDLYPLLIGGGTGSVPHTEHILFYKAEDNRCGPPYEEPLEWEYGGTLRTNSSCSLVLRQARAPRATGPWVVDRSARGEFFTDAISRPCVEGPTAIRAPDGAWLLLFDNYRTDCLLLAPNDQRDVIDCGSVAGRSPSQVGLRFAAARPGGRCAYAPQQLGFGALRSTDLVSWADISGDVRVPARHKHGTAIRLTARAWRGVCAGARESSRVHREGESSPPSYFGRICEQRRGHVGGEEEEEEEEEEQQQQQKAEDEVEAAEVVASADGKPPKLAPTRAPTSSAGRRDGRKLWAGADWSKLRKTSRKHAHGAGTT
jgi:hypothetical protein